MLYLIDLLNIIDIFLAFIILDRLSLKDKKISIGVIMTLLIVANLQRRLVFPVVADLFFIVLLVSLSYMNRREQPIGITLLHLVCAFGVFQLNNFLLYPRDVLLFIGLKASEWQIILYLLFTVGIGVVMSLILRKYVIQRVKQFWKQRVGYLLFVVLLINKFTHLFQYLSSISPGTERKMLTEVTVSLSVLLIGIFALIILIFSNNQKLAFETKEKEIEQRAMQLYIHEISKQNQAIRQFKHDYINILSSLEGYIELGDLAEMKAYYEETIQPTGQLLDSENARLADLRKIEPLGLRSLLTIKLLFAQEKGIEVHLEIEEIDWQIKVNEIDLIRVVGILLDNAIEELENLGQGRLDVALFSKENESRLLIRNTVRTMIEPLHQLKAPGFSTKGDGRGLGLSTVETLVNQSSFFFLETKIDSNYFLQNLTIAGGSDA
ncbi:sensor histidine kinase [Enterococcus sp.]|uniref:sensor histidine kinase n=1 Tax=Enterococcus sp. TaxID=35783 RepID=UPI002FC9C0D1